MDNQAAVYVGLMSGTSLDSVDAVAVSFEPKFTLVATHTEAIPDQLKQSITRLMLPSDKEIDRMGKIDIQLGQLFAKAANELIKSNNLNRSNIQAIGSHGQTVRHRPEFGFTLQIGDANIIAEQTGITTVADFRRRDMAAGGQGAPLVPAFHHAMLHSSAKDRVLLNIGGMANITYLPSNQEKPISGFDTGPGNILMDAWINDQRKLGYDEDGTWAASGKINNNLLSSLLQLEYFQEAPPKSTGREQFNLNWLKQKLHNFNHIQPEDVQATLAALTAQTIADSIKRFTPCFDFELLVCGGGSHNQFLLQQLRSALPAADIANSDIAGIEADWMEAAAFAWLAMRCLEGKTGNISDATGASGERILGAIYQA